MTEITIVVIPADDEQTTKVTVIEQGDLRAMQSIVGGLIEPIELECPEPAEMYVNGEGKLIGLPLNRRATFLMWDHNPFLRDVDVVMGDVLIAGPVDDEGEMTSVPQAYVELVVGDG